MSTLMALLNRSLFKKIEGKLHNRLEIRAKVNKWYSSLHMYTPADQALSRQPMDITNVGGGVSKHTDNTAITAIRRTVPPPDIRSMEQWLKVIDKMYAKLADGKKQFFDSYYNGRREKYKTERLCEKLYIDIRTGYLWREEIVNLTALTAAICGVLREKEN